MNIPSRGGRFQQHFQMLCATSICCFQTLIFQGAFGIPPFHSTSPFSKRRVPKIRVPKTQFWDVRPKLQKISLNIFLKFPKRSLNPNEFSTIWRCFLVEGHHRPSTLWKLIRHLHLPVANCTACRQDAKPCVGCQFWTSCKLHKIKIQKWFEKTTNSER